MTPAQGYTVFVGVAPESTYGTYVAPTSFQEVTDEKFKMSQKRVWKPTLGSVSQAKSVIGPRKVAGGFKMPMVYQGTEQLLKQLFGQVTTTTVVGSVKQHVFALTAALPTGCSMTVDRDTVGLGGGSKCFGYTGCQVSKMTLSQSPDNFMDADFEFVGQDETLQVRPTPTFGTFFGVDWLALGTFTIGGTSYPVTMTELVVENALNAGRHKLGSQLVQGVGRSGIRKVSGKLEVEFTSDTYALYTAYRGQATAGALQLIWTGGVAASATNYKLQIDAPSLFLTGDTPNVKDAGIVKMPMTFELDASAGADGSEFVMTLVNLLAAVI